MIILTHFSCFPDNLISTLRISNKIHNHWYKMRWHCSLLSLSLSHSQVTKLSPDAYQVHELNFNTFDPTGPILRLIFISKRSIFVLKIYYKYLRRLVLESESKRNTIYSRKFLISLLPIQSQLWAQSMYVCVVQWVVNRGSRKLLS